MSLSWISEASPIALAVLGVLLAFSVVSWSIILLKIFTLRKAGKSSMEFTDLFWKIRRLEQVYEESRRFDKSPVAQVFRKGYQELQTDDLGLEHTLRKAGMAEVKELESHISFLATVGSTSPFIGLFGTVVGIMTSFEQIGSKGSASLATVAPGIAEALIATAAGLLAAIPAVIAYNYFSSRIRAIALDIETFSSDFLNIARRHAKTP